MLSALQQRTQRQYLELRAANRGGGKTAGSPEWCRPRWYQRDAAQRSRLDAALFPACAALESPVVALSRTKISATANIDAEAVERGPRREARHGQTFHGARRLAGSSGPAGALGSGGDVCAFCRSGADWHASKPRRRTGDRLHPYAPGTSREKQAGDVDDIARNSRSGLSRICTTANAAARDADRDFAGIPAHRLAGSPRLLSPLYSR